MEFQHALHGLPLSELVVNMGGSIHEAEKRVLRLEGVASCHLRTDESGGVVDVWVTTRGARSASDVRADVVAVLATEFGIDVLEEQVHVEPAPEDVHPAVLEELEIEGRPRLVAVRAEISEESTQVEVELALGSETALGRASARGAARAPELLAEACLEALERLCAGRVAFRLVAVRREGVGPAEVVTAVVQEIDGREVRLHVGAARLEDDIGRAAAYATLQSLNRRFGRILALPPRQYRVA
jgi:hypothetical protein